MPSGEETNTNYIVFGFHLNCALAHDLQHSKGTYWSLHHHCDVVLYFENKKYITYQNNIYIFSIQIKLHFIYGLLL